ncbi:hypothetical protein HMN09_01419300 [Mycena chlorophos]|uniref:Uncharacterized protein n=1 Tax=Mycena chlorophos TaxID=658473 RepID=A0A8H6VSA6_MYCCL|nr:hypothetical protein HMN09_01419300 [Mycena chlorophos]
MPYPLPSPTARSRTSSSDVLSIASSGTEYSVGFDWELYTCTSPASALSCAQQSSQCFPDTPRDMDFPESPLSVDFTLSPVLEDASSTELSPLIPQFPLPTSVPSSVNNSTRLPASADPVPLRGLSRVPKISGMLNVTRRRAHTVDVAAPQDVLRDAQPEIRVVTPGLGDSWRPRRSATMPSASTLLRGMLGIDDTPTYADPGIRTSPTPEPAQSHSADLYSAPPPAKSAKQSSAQTSRHNRDSSWGDVRVTKMFTQATGAADLDELDDSVREALYINAALRSRGLSYLCAAAEKAEDATSAEKMPGLAAQASTQARSANPRPPATLHRTATLLPVRVPSLRPSISDEAPISAEPFRNSPALRKAAPSPKRRRPLPAIPVPALPRAKLIPASFPGQLVDTQAPN